MKKISAVHWLLVVIAAVQLMMSLGLTLLTVRFGMDIPIVLQLVLSQGTLFVPLIIFCLVKHVHPKDLLRFGRVRLSNLVMAFLVLLFSYPVIILLNLISMLFVDNAMVSAMDGMLSLGLPLGLFFMAVVPAIVEESVFRGAVYNTYSRRYPIGGIFLSGLLFGIMHGNFNQMPYAMFLGIILALMLEATDSIITTMFMHFLLNGFSTAMSFLMPAAPEGTSGNLRESLEIAYSQTLSDPSMKELTKSLGGMYDNEVMVSQMISMALGMVIGVLAVIALVCLAVVVALIYATFRINHRRPKDVLFVHHEETAVVEGRGGRLRKNRMLDLPVTLFILFNLIQCILNAL